MPIFYLYILSATQKTLETNSWLNLETQIANTSKIPLFGGSFCKFKGVLKISPGKDPDFRDQRPNKTYSRPNLMLTSENTPLPPPRFDSSIRGSALQTKRPYIRHELSRRLRGDVSSLIY